MWKVSTKKYEKTQKATILVPNVIMIVLLWARGVPLLHAAMQLALTLCPNLAEYRREKKHTQTHTYIPRTIERDGGQLYLPRRLAPWCHVWLHSLYPNCSLMNQTWRYTTKILKVPRASGAGMYKRILGVCNPSKNDVNIDDDRPRTNRGRQRSGCALWKCTPRGYTHRCSRPLVKAIGHRAET